MPACGKNASGFRDNLAPILCEKPVSLSFNRPDMKHLKYLIPVLLLWIAGCSKDRNTPEPPREVIKEELDVTYGAHPLQKMDVYFPEGYDQKTPVVFLIHGGAFIAGTKEDFTSVAKLFVAKGYIAVNLSHRLVNATGLTSKPPLHQRSDVTVSDQVKDMGLAVETYRKHSADWGSGTGRMYMAGHSAGGTLAMLYVQGKDNQHLRASGNLAGLTNLTLTEELYNNPPDLELWPAVSELLYRMSGKEVIPENALALMAISPNWVVSANKPGKPNMTVMARSNDSDLRFEPYFSTIGDAEAFDAQLRFMGTASGYILMDTDHGFGTHPEDWSLAVGHIVEFFNEH